MRIKVTGMGRFDGKVVVVTGSGRGIGRATALAFAREGADVVVNVSKSVDEGNAVVEEIKALGRGAIMAKADVANEAEVEKMIKTAIDHFRKVDVLVNNAGIGISAMSYKMTKEQWDAVVDVNLTGVFNCFRAVVPRMMERRSGKIINISSVAGIDGFIGNINYAASKGGLLAFNRTAATELGRYGINVNAVAPGIIETQMTEWIKIPKYRDMYLSRIPLGRFGKPEDIASVVLFLASEEANYITGQVIRVDGGILFPT